MKCLVSGWKLSSSVGGGVGGVLVRVLKKKLCVSLLTVISLIKMPDVSWPSAMIRINSLEGAAGPQKVCIASRFLAVQSSKSGTRQLPRSGDGWCKNVSTGIPVEWLILVSLPFPSIIISCFCRCRENYCMFLYSRGLTRTQWLDGFE